MEVSEFSFEFDNDAFLSSSLMLQENTTLNILEANKLIASDLIRSIRHDYEELHGKRKGKKLTKKFLRSVIRTKLIKL
ncbi:hypothetical protein [Flavobacterium pectinovorum]|uniref:Uncharacterized protein n=1 Tax=Flavobacterium pectinovorum TaxID=29533 RepID=A0A502F6D2_9FLAO|nr:hypothetical protein [Flavobacterium pectinovorum]TPG44351.1 hypothetical protein EAH81_02435 [Flavobacterium pectinovorum]